jgi:hypothetical protein
MSASHMRFEERLVGDSNWSPWKARMVFVLEDLKLWNIVEAHVPVLLATAPILLVEFGKRNNKEKRTICDAICDHIIPHLTGKTYAYEMCSSLCNLYESSNENQKMVLHDQLRGIRMLKDESVTSFLGRYTQIRDDIGATREVVDPNSLLRQDMNSFTKPWGPFVRGIVSSEVMPTWERMWDDFIQEEIRLVDEASGQWQKQQQQYGQGDEDISLWKMARRRLVVGVGRVPSLGPHHRGVEEREAVVREVVRGEI